MRQPRFVATPPGRHAARLKLEKGIEKFAVAVASPLKVNLIGRSDAMIQCTVTLPSDLPDLVYWRKPITGSSQAGEIPFRLFLMKCSVVAEVGAELVLQSNRRQHIPTIRNLPFGGDTHPFQKDVVQNLISKTVVQHPLSNNCCQHTSFRKS